MRKRNILLSSSTESSRSEMSACVPVDLKTLSPHQTKDLIHELQVHQIELKIQNEELCRIQAELEKSQARYFGLYDLAPVGYITVDKSGLILEGNLVAATILDVPKGALVKQPLVRFILKEDQDIYYLHRKQLFETGGPKTVELRMAKKDGSRFWARLDSTITQNADGMSVCRVVLSDITERKRAEEVLQQSEKRYRRLFESAKDGILIIDEKTGLVIDVNPYLLELLDFSYAYFIGKAIWELGEFKDIFSSKDAFCELKAKEYIRYDDLPLKTNDGRVINVEFVSNVYVVDYAKVIQCNIRDITERKKAEEALRESEEKFRNYIEMSPDGVFTVDTTGRYLDANKSACRITGFSREEIEKMSISELVAEESAEDGAAHFKKLMETGSSTSDLWHKRKDGSKRCLTVSGVKLSEERILGFCTDITERKQAEEKQKKIEDQLRQSQKLEAIGQLSSGIAHDFNNLLGGIMGHAELLKMELNPESPLQRHPEVIIASCEKAADLTRQLLSFARKAPVELQKIDLNAFLKQVVGLMDRTIDRRIEIVTNIPEQPAFISGDRNQLENALLNIAINARDAMPEGGHLCIAAETVNLNQTAFPEEPGEVVEGAYARISIADTGTGMSKEIKDRIFEPFFTTKEDGKGTGLGLASVYGCVKQHNGYIAVESQVGKGTRFDLYFPQVTSAGEAGATQDARLVRGKGTLLVVDDEPIFHEILTEIFTSLGYTVHCCTKGAKAVEYYREHASAIQVVILDMNMPKMNGLQCFRHLKEINPGAQVIVSSGYGENRDREAMQKEGVRMFVQKPYKAVELSMKIAELINTRLSCTV